MISSQSCRNSVSNMTSDGLEQNNFSRKTDDNHVNSTSVMDEMSILQHIETFWKFFFNKGERQPLEQLPRKKVVFGDLLDGGSNQLRVTWLGHSSVFININGYTILTDPLFERKISPIGPTSFHDDLVLEVEDITSIDMVIISHDHYDHLNKFSVKSLAEKADRFIVPQGVGKRLIGWGIPAQKIVELRWWEEYSPNNDLTIAATPAQHFSGRGLTDRNKTLWASWAIICPNHRVFFSGDSGYFNGFKEIGKKYGPFDMTFIECGAYDERWRKVHMFPEETILAHRDLAGKVLQPIHLATFNLAFHAWYEPMERLVSEAWKEGVTVSLPVAGEIVNFHNIDTSDFWWQPSMERRIKKRKSEGIIYNITKNMEEVE